MIYVCLVLLLLLLLFFFFFFFFFFSSRRRHTRYIGDWSSDVCSSDLGIFRGRRDHALQADRIGITVGRLGVATDRGDGSVRGLGVGHPAGEPAIAQSPHASIGGLGAATDPDRQTPALRRLRLHAHGHEAAGRLRD